MSERVKMGALIFVYMAIVLAVITLIKDLVNDLIRKKAANRRVKESIIFMNQKDGTCIDVELDFESIDTFKKLHNLFNEVMKSTGYRNCLREKANREDSRVQDDRHDLIFPSKVNPYNKRIPPATCSRPPHPGPRKKDYTEIKLRLKSDSHNLLATCEFEGDEELLFKNLNSSKYIQFRYRVKYSSLGKNDIEFIKYRIINTDEISYIELI